MKFLPKRQRIAWSRRVTKEAYEKDLAEAKAAKDWKLVQDLKSRRMFELRLIDEEEGEFLTGKLVAEAHKFVVPLPSKRTEAGQESEFWYQGTETGQWILTIKAQRDLRDEIRREKKARHESRFLWTSWISALTGLLGVVTGLVALLKK